MKRKLSRRICEAKLLRGDAACVSLPKPTMSNSWTTKPNRFSVLPKLNQPTGQFVSARSGIYAPQFHQSTTLLKESSESFSGPKDLNFRNKISDPKPCGPASEEAVQLVRGGIYATELTPSTLFFKESAAKCHFLRKPP